MPQYDFPWEREAMRNSPMPDGLTITDQLAYQALAHLYARYNLKKIDRMAASAEKKQIKFAWEKRKSLDACDKRLSDYHTRVIRDVEIYSTAYRKAKSQKEAIEAANGIVAAIDNIPVINRFEK